MRTKKNTPAVLSAVETSAILSAPIVAIDSSEYLRRASLSGNPLIKAAVETRLYENGRENGTTAVLLAILATGNVADKVTSIEVFADLYKALKDESFKADSWLRLEKIYGKIPGNRSSNPAKKIGPVVTGLIREGKAGSLKGFAVEKIGTESLRKTFGFSF
jgi:hypothetical protein